LSSSRAAVAAALATADGGDERLLGARGELLERGREANRRLIDGPTLPAWQRFTGVVWDHLAPYELTGQSLGRAEDSVLVVSAVTGLSAWSDPVPDFRLKLSVSLGALGRLDRFWRPTLTELLDEHLAGRTVVDLLPNEHRGAWVPNPDRYDLIRPVLTAPDGRPAGHDAKAAKGLLARALLEDDDVGRTLATFDPSPLRLRVETVAPV
jgi:hypothetical protein